MGEKFNFICIGDHSMVPTQLQSEIIRLLASVECLSATVPVEAIRLNFKTNIESKATWSKFLDLCGEPLNEDELLFVYFKSPSLENQISLSLNQFNTCFTELTLSIDFSYFESLMNNLFWEKIAISYSSWGARIFHRSLVACGPELDSSQLNNESDFARLAQLWQEDARNWMMASTLRFSRRVAKDC